MSEYISSVYEIVGSGQPTAEDMVTIDNYLANNYTGTVCAYQSSMSVTDMESGNAVNTEYNTNANDYKTSTIRRYMNYTGDNKVVKHASWQDAGGLLGAGELPEDLVFGCNESSQATNMVTDLNIDIEQDIIYNEIFARSLKDDLYADIGASNTDDEVGTAVDVPDVTVQGLNDTDSDKFWLLSVAEANTLFPAGSSGDADRDWNGTDQLMDEEGNFLMDIYWLRSPNSSDTVFAYNVYSDGNVDSVYVIYFNAARPAFQINE